MYREDGHLGARSSSSRPTSPTSERLLFRLPWADRGHPPTGSHPHRKGRLHTLLWAGRGHSPTRPHLHRRGGLQPVRRAGRGHPPTQPHPHWRRRGLHRFQGTGRGHLPTRPYQHRRGGLRSLRWAGRGHSPTQPHPHWRRGLPGLRGASRDHLPTRREKALSSTPRLSPARTLVAGSRFGSKPGHQTLAITYQNMGTPIKTWANYQNLGKLSKPGNFEIIKTWASKIKIK